MKFFYYSGEGQTPCVFPLGGIGTGAIGFSSDGRLCGFDLSSAYNFNSAYCTFSAEVYRENELVSQKLLQSASAENTSKDVFSHSGFYAGFPFAKKVYEGSGFMGKITQTVFTPFIPHNETDSGIPCAFLEFEIENTSDEALKYTVKGLCGGFFEICENTVGCTDSGALYINTSDSTKSGSIFEASVCLSTDAKNFSYNLNERGGAFSISASVSLMPHEKKTVSFVLSWYFPIRENIICPETRLSFETHEEYTSRNSVRNYYSQYFESSIECTSYCFAQRERLRSDTLTFTNALYGSTLPDSILKAVSESLCVFRSTSILRLCEGDLYVLDRQNEKLSLSSLENAFALQFLFPLIDKSSTNSLIKHIHDGKEASTVLPIMRALSSFLITGDFEALVESWPTLARCIDSLLENATSVSIALYAYCLKICAYLSQVVKDKNRESKCREKLSAIPSVYGGSEIAPAFIHADTMGMSQGFEVSPDSYSECARVYPLQTAAIMIRRGLCENAMEILSKMQSTGDGAFCTGTSAATAENALCAYALICASSGLEYNAYEKHIRFTPEMRFADKTGTFKCFFSLGTCFGYAEQGIDYIEINLLYGKLTVRSFGTPTRPLMVLYGGRKWKFEDTCLCAKLDCDLTVTPDKKLTVIIDVRKQSI